MTFSNPNTGAFVWSRTAADITLSGLQASQTVQFTVYLNGSAVATFSLVSSQSGNIVIRFGEILEAILPRRDATIPSTTSSYTNTVYIRATLNNDTLDTSTMFCFRGGSDSLQSAFPHTTQFLTWKPQIVRTYPWAIEVISLIKPKSTSITVTGKVYLSNNSSVTVTLGTFSSSSTQVAICQVNISPSRIQGFSSVSGNTVLGYDVYTNNILAHRFIIKPNRVRAREFLFINSLGVLDTAFATGDMERDTDLAVSTFTASGLEKELTNEACESFKVSTGGIRERRMMDHWQDFFRSTERFVRLQGDVTRRIIVDSVEPEMTENTLSSAAFTYHYADRFTGRYHADVALSAFDPSDVNN